MINKQKNNYGFTLLEVVIYVALAGLILLGLVYFLIAISQARAKMTAVSEVQASERQIFIHLNRLLKNSASINWGSSLLNNHPGRLVLMNNQSQIITIKIDGDGYLIVDTDGQITKLSNNWIKINQLVFERIDDQTVKVQLGLNYWPTGADATFIYSGSWQSIFRVMN